MKGNGRENSLTFTTKFWHLESVDTTLLETSSIFQMIAISTGLPLIVVEVGGIILTIILILAAILMVSATLRIKKEMISLNFKIGYMARLLKRELDGSAKKKVADETKEPEKEETYKEEWKF